jgi:hypothetical protein
MTASRTVRTAILAAVTVAGIFAGGAGIAAATGLTDADGGKDPETPLTGDALTGASRAALDQVGDGVVTDTELGDEESRYEVEVTRPDGQRVDVQLDESFTVVGSSTDREGDDRDAD